MQRIASGGADSGRRASSGGCADFFSQHPDGVCGSLAPGSASFRLGHPAGVLRAVREREFSEDRLSPRIAGQGGGKLCGILDLSGLIVELDTQGDWLADSAAVSRRGPCEVNAFPDPGSLTASESRWFTLGST